MRVMRKVFGWFYAFVSGCVLFAFVVSLRADLSREHGRLRFGAVGVLSLLLLFIFVFTIAWWSSWKDTPSVRIWGIAASLTNLSVFLFLIFAEQRPLTKIVWQVIVLSVFSLITYIWPEREERLGVKTLHENPDSSTN
jgi:O-antigen/teichoic acid export membrane protein